MTDRDGQVEGSGERYYVPGARVEHREFLKGSGCRWDLVRRSWWTDNEEQADSLARSLVSSARFKGPNPLLVVAGRGYFDDRLYHIAGTGRKSYDTGLQKPVTTRSGSIVLLANLDGSLARWAALSEVHVVELYKAPSTVGAIQSEHRRVERDLRFAAGRCPECGAVAEAGDGSLCGSTGLTH